LRLPIAWVVAAKDMNEFRRNRYVMWTLVGMPITLSLVPLMSLLIPMLFFPSSMSDSDRMVLLKMLPSFTLPMLSMVPAITPSIIASYSFVGEKVNRSLEPLLATPTTDYELLVGKSLAAFVPTMVGTYAAFLIDIVLIDWAALPILGYLIVPDLSWAIAIVLLSPSFCVLSIEANVLVSSRMSDVRAAQQVGGLVVMPMVLIYLVSLTNFFPLTPTNMLLISGLTLSAVLVLGSFTKRVFQREEILTKWK